MTVRLLWRQCHNYTAVVDVQTVPIRGTSQYTSPATTQESTDVTLQKLGASFPPAAQRRLQGRW